MTSMRRTREIDREGERKKRDSTASRTGRTTGGMIGSMDEHLGKHIFTEADEGVSLYYATFLLMGKRKV